jgi:hypothetical protein
MKRVALVLSVLAVIGFAVGTSYADPKGDAKAHVYVKVDPNIAVKPLAATVNAGTVQVGNFSAIVPFRVDANTEAVNLWAACSQLYKGNDPLGTEVAPIALSGGVPIQPTNANPVGGASNVASYAGAGEDVDGFPTLITNSIVFESSQNGHFSQDVSVTCSWNQDDPEKPTGEYSGVVKFYAEVVL